MADIKFDKNSSQDLVKEFMDAFDKYKKKNLRNPYSEVKILGEIRDLTKKMVGGTSNGLSKEKEDIVKVEKEIARVKKESIKQDKDQLEDKKYQSKEVTDIHQKEMEARKKVAENSEKMDKQMNKGFSKVKAGLLALGGAMLGATKVITNAADQQIKMAQSGLSTNLVKFSKSATNSSLNLENFGRVVQDNNVSISKLASNGKKGYEVFGRMNKVVQDEIISKKNLLYTDQEAVEATSHWIEMMNASGKLSQMSDAEKTKASGEYIYELHKLSIITGKSRKELMSQQKARADTVQMKILRENNPLIDKMIDSIQGQGLSEDDAMKIAKYAATGRYDAGDKAQQGLVNALGADRVMAISQETDATRRQVLIAEGIEQYQKQNDGNLSTSTRMMQLEGSEFLAAGQRIQVAKGAKTSKQIKEASVADDKERKYDNAVSTGMNDAKRDFNRTKGDLRTTIVSAIDGSKNSGYVSGMIKNLTGLGATNAILTAILGVVTFRSGIGGKMMGKLKGAGKMAGGLIKGGGKMAGGLIKGAGSVLKGGGKMAGKGMAKIAGKGIGKSLLKKIPGIGLLAGLGFGVSRLMSGDWKGAIGEVASGAASLVPGIGTAASMAIDAGLAGRDMGAFDKSVETEKSMVEKTTSGSVKNKTSELSLTSEVMQNQSKSIKELNMSLIRKLDDLQLVLEKGNSISKGMASSGSLLNVIR